MNIKTFAELEVAEQVTFEELHATLEDYARGGWAICARVVNKLVDRVKPDVDEQAATLFGLARVGWRNQTKRCEVEAAKEYKDVMEHLKQKRT